MSDTSSAEPPKAGDNSLAPEELRKFVERIENLEEEKAALLEDIKSVYEEVKAGGLDVKTVRKAIAVRKQDQKVRKAEEELLRLYLKALGVK